MRLPAATLAFLLVAGCGAPQADGGYRGEPLRTLAGRLEGDARTSNLHAPYLGIIWMVFDFTSGQGTGRVVTSVVPVPNATFPGDFHLELYDPPPPEAFGELFGVRFALGAIVALDDVDGDRRFVVDPETGALSGTDRFFGSSFWYGFLLYVDRVDDRTCAETLWENPEALLPGQYQLASLDECGFTFSVLPPETPVRLILFPTARALPDAPPQYVEPNCEDEELLCLEHPEDPVCRGIESSYTCQVASCGAESDAYDSCVTLHCMEAIDFFGCSREWCDAEEQAFGDCVTDRCSGTALCAFL